MNKSLFFLWSCLFFTMFSGISIAEPLKQVPPAELRIEESSFAAIDLWIQQLMEADNIPGAIVAVGRGDKLALLKMWGERHRNPTPEPITLDTMYDLASCGKVVGLAPAIAMLVDQGKVSYSDPVAKYLPKIGNHGKENITIFDFLTHTSGIQDGYSWEGTPDAIWKRICQVPCKAKPGQQFEYSCLGCLILGKMVERISGETYADWTRNHLFLPLGMVDTMFLPDAERCKRVAVTQFMDGQWIRGIPNDTRSRRMKSGTGNGANFSTISDVALFASTMLHKGEYTNEKGEVERLFSPEVFDRMVASYPTTAGIRGLGWDKRSNKSNRGTLMSPQAIGHGGYTGTSIWIDPAFNTFVVVLSTRLNINPHAPNIYPTAGKIADCVIDAIRDPHNETQIRKAVRSSVLSPQESQTFRTLKGRKVGVLASSQAVDQEGIPSVVKMLRAGIDVKVVYCLDQKLEGRITVACQNEKLPIPPMKKFSDLDSRRLLPQHIQGLNTLVFDAVASGKGNDQTITDLGQAMQSAVDNGLMFYVLDHFNPVGMHDVAGDFPASGSEPALAFRRLPSSYAMSVGELALLFNSEYRMGLSLFLIPCQEVDIPVLGTEKEPIVTDTIHFHQDAEWFKYQRTLYLIYPRSL